MPMRISTRNINGGITEEFEVVVPTYWWDNPGLILWMEPAPEAEIFEAVLKASNEPLVFVDLRKETRLKTNILQAQIAKSRRERNQLHAERARAALRSSRNI